MKSPELKGISDYKHTHLLLFTLIACFVFRCQERFKTKTYDYVDANSKCMLFLHSANAWMGFRLVSISQHA